MIIKRCACGRLFDETSWKELKIVGGMDPEDEERPSYILELRNCTCGTTLAIEKDLSKEQAAAITEAAHRLDSDVVADLTEYWRERVREAAIQSLWIEKRDQFWSRK